MRLATRAGQGVQAYRCRCRYVRCRYVENAVTSTRLACKLQLQLRHMALAGAQYVRFARFAGLCPPAATETVACGVGCE